MTESVPWLDQLGPAAVTLVVAFVAGLVIDLVLNMLLKARAESRSGRIGLALAQSLRGLPIFVTMLIGVRLVVNDLALPGRYAEPLDKAITVGAILIATAFAARITAKLVATYLSREDTRLPSSTIFVNLARGVIWIMGAIFVLGALGVSIAPLVTALGVGGLAVGLALQPTLENVFSGIQVLLSRQIEPGDFIQLETGQQGWVEDVTWRNTTIKLLSNDLVIVPNATIGKSLITNFTTNDEQHILWVPFGVAYESDLEHVERVVLGVAGEVQSHAEYAVPEFEPVLRFTEFADSAIHAQVSLRADSFGNRFALRHEFIMRLKVAFDAEGITIPLPQRVVHVETPA